LQNEKFVWAKRIQIEEEFAELRRKVPFHKSGTFALQFALQALA
jgi:hypothetical protein